MCRCMRILLANEWRGPNWRIAGGRSLDICQVPCTRTYFAFCSRCPRWARKNPTSPDERCTQLFIMSLSDSHLLDLIKAHSARTESISPIHEETSETETFESFPPGLTSASVDNVASKPTDRYQAELAEAYRLRDEAVQAMAALQAKCDEQQAKVRDTFGCPND